MIIDHVNVPVRDIKRARLFYELILALFGLSVLLEEEDVVGFGADHWVFGIFLGEGEPNHIAFKASSREQVDGFHATALKAGGTDHGSPGIRAQYGEGYYAAYVLDPDGHNIEAVFRE